MKIYIPNHLRKLAVVDQLAKMVEAYSEKITNTEDSTAAVNQSKCTDPVKKFIYMRLDSSAEIFTSGSQNYADVVNYLTSLFYSVKGTRKVLDYMKKYLGFSDNEVVYDVKSISIFPTGANLGDESLYYDTLLEFLSELLYFEEFKTDIGSVNLLIDHNVVTKVLASKDIHCYKTITIKQQR